MTFRTSVVPLVAALALVVSVNAVASDLTIAGSTTVQKRLFEPAGAKLAEATGVNVKFQGVGTGKGMIALVDDKVSVAAASETLEGAIGSGEKAAKSMEKSFTPPSNLKFHQLAKDSIVIIVNKENPVSSLSKDQLKAINTGKITNWKEVGGPDLPIKVVTSHSGSATRAVFQQQIMDKAEYVSGVVEVRTTREEINEVSKDKRGIGAVSEGFFAMNQGNAKLVKAPDISRPLGLVTKGEATPEVKKIVEFFVSGEGKALIQ